MNQLFQATKAQILERRLFKRSTFADNQILAAIETYEIVGSSKRHALSFINALTPLWKLYKKEAFVSIFKDFIDMEMGLETFTVDHSSHANHVLQEFLFGYNLIMNCSTFQTVFKIDQNRNNPQSEFGELFFAWMAASLLHDIGYDIEKAPEEEEFRNRKNKFWDFMTRRAFTENPLTLRGKANNIIENHLLPEINEMSNSKLSFVQFENLIQREVPTFQGWVQYDHGVISSIKYLIELEKLEEQSKYDYLNWQPNKMAAVAMALHNFRYKNTDIKLSLSDPKSILSYLLILCDEIQEWERERYDADSDLDIQGLTGKGAKLLTELSCITFRDNYAYVALNHRLKDPSLKNNFQKYLNQRFVALKRDYPVQILISEVHTSIRDILLKTASQALDIMIPNILPSFTNIASFNLDTLAKDIYDIIGLRKMASARLKRAY